MINNSEKDTLSKGKYISIIVGGIIAGGSLSLPIGVTKIAHQDGWISTMFGVTYPLYIVILSIFIIERYPNDDIIAISKKNLGNIVGKIFNFIFFTFCVFVECTVISIYSSLIRNYAVGWLTPIKTITICTLIVAYSAYKGMQTIGRISEVALVLTIILIMLPISALKVSSLLNIQPILGSGSKAILSGSIESILSYSGAELIFLFYPYVKEKNKIKRYSFISVFISMIVYTWICFISIFYLGPDIVTKSQWPFLLVTQVVTITVINNFSYLFILIWSLIAIKCAVIYYYCSIKILKDFIPKIKTKNIYIAIYPVSVYFALKMGNELSRKVIADKLVKIYTIFNLIYITLITIVIFIKKIKTR